MCENPELTECGAKLLEIGIGSYTCSSPCWDMGTCEALAEEGDSAQGSIDACYAAVRFAPHSTTERKFILISCFILEEYYFSSIMINNRIYLRYQISKEISKKRI